MGTLHKRSMLTRKGMDYGMKGLAVIFTALALVFLVWILFVVLLHGGKALSLTFLLEPTKPYGIEDAGIGNAFVGTVLITLVACLISVPLGMLGGIYLAEFSRNSKLGNWVRFSANVMMGIPSIIVGLFIYSLVVYTTKNFSGFAGSLALAIIMFPVVLRTTEDMLCMVPNALREAALALGMPRWRATLCIIFKAARGGLITGVLLAMARVSGETAPLLFTALWSDAWPWPPSRFFVEPTANLTVTITEYATNSPFEEMHIRAWGASLIITVIVLVINISARTLFREEKR